MPKLWRVTLWTHPSAGQVGGCDPDTRVVIWPWMDQKQAFHILKLLDGNDNQYINRIQYRQNE